MDEEKVEGSNIYLFLTLKINKKDRDFELANGSRCTCSDM